MAQQIVRFQDVLQQVKLSRSTLYGRIAEGTFPKPFQLGEGSRAVGFLQADIDQWVSAQHQQCAHGGEG